MTLPASPSARPRRRHAFALVAVAVILTAVVALAASATASSFTARILFGGSSSSTEADGVVVDSTPLTVDDTVHPAMTRLDSELRDALRQAQTAAASDGIVFDITSGWRSASYQRWLLDDAIRQYGSEEVAHEYVATPDESSHVTGQAVDIGTLDAQLWLIENGREWGLCQTYANERWHFERATDAGGECPAPHHNARG